MGLKRADDPAKAGPAGTDGAVVWLGRAQGRLRTGEREKATIRLLSTAPGRVVRTAGAAVARAAAVSDLWVAGAAAFWRRGGL